MSNYRINIKRYDLDTETIDKVVQDFGNYLQVVGASTDAATIRVTPRGENLDVDGRLPLQNRDFVGFPDAFNRVALTWDAQPGEWVDLMFFTQDPAPEEFVYVRGQRTTVDSIAETVNVSPVANNSAANTIVSVGTSSVQLVALDGDRKIALIRNNHTTNTLYVGESPATTAGSFPVGPCEVYEHTAITALHGIASGAGTDVRIRTEGNV